MSAGVVIDVGCTAYNGANSIEYLIDEFRPAHLIGFDPTAVESTYVLGETHVATYPVAGWIYDGMVGFEQQGNRGHVTTEQVQTQVLCVDLARVIREQGRLVILKLDAEGAEYALLEHLILEDADLLVELAWVEWHGDQYERRAKICDALRCNVGTWRL